MLQVVEVLEKKEAKSRKAFQPSRAAEAILQKGESEERHEEDRQHCSMQQ